MVAYRIVHTALGHGAPCTPRSKPGLKITPITRCTGSVAPLLQTAPSPQRQFNTLIDSAGTLLPAFSPGQPVQNFPQSCWGLDVMAVPLSWKIGGAFAGLFAVVLLWNGVSQLIAAHQAEEITRESAHAAALDAQVAKAHAEQSQAQLAADLKQHREALSSNYQQIKEDARLYQAEQAIRLNKQRQEQLRIQASYKLDSNQQCVGGIVIKRSGGTFSQPVGMDGKPIRCLGDTAAQPLR